jgi:hypothetical protein
MMLHEGNTASLVSQQQARWQRANRERKKNPQNQIHVHQHYQSVHRARLQMMRIDSADGY